MITGEAKNILQAHALRDSSVPSRLRVQAQAQLQWLWLCNASSHGVSVMRECRGAVTAGEGALEGIYEIRKREGIGNRLGIGRRDGWTDRKMGDGKMETGRWEMHEWQMGDAWETLILLLLLLWRIGDGFR